MPMVVIGGGRKRFEIVGVSDSDPYIHGFLDENRDSEPGLQRFCREHFRDDAVALDIGANIGVTPLILSEHFKRGYVHAVEPGNNTFSALEKNIANSDVKNVNIYKYAISNKSETVRFSDNSAWGGIAKDDNLASNVHELQALRLDDLVKKLNLFKLDFIKADIEGFEPLLFEGGSQTIEKFGPVIYFELNSWAMMVNGPFDPIGFLEKVAEKYPYVYRVGRDHDAPEMLQRIEGSPKWIAQQLVHDNVVHFGSVNDVVVSKRELHPIVDAYAAHKIAELEKQISVLSGELGSVRHGAESAQKDNEELRFALEDANTKISDLNEIRNVLEKEISDKNSQIVNLDNLIVDINDDLIFAKTKVAAISGDWTKANCQKLLANARILQNAFKVDIGNREFIENVYKAFLCRESDSTGFDHHLSSLENGVSRMTVFLNIAETSEFREKHL